jgi:glycopeptide antibiotics resistance protein
VIAILSFIPGNQLPEIKLNLISIDTLAHFIMYAFLAYAMCLGGLKKNLNLSKPTLYLIILLVGIIYGTSIELIQGFYIYQRFFDTADIFANTVGTIFGVLAARLTSIKLV